MAKKTTSKKTPAGGVPAQPQPSFEDAMEELEGIVDAIESGELTLEASIAAYERGVALVAGCRESLSGAEQRISDLTERLDGADDTE
ncbi:MAG: exodeoxyribonuclease VII small subunit [Planctomycetota bacterium]